jgi:hypothetical protein
MIIRAVINLVRAIPFCLFCLIFSTPAPDATSGTGRPDAGGSFHGAPFDSEGTITVRNIAFGPNVEPTLEGIQSYINDLDRDLRNMDFRIQYLYHSRQETLQHIAGAKRLADKLKK